MEWKYEDLPSSGRVYGGRAGRKKGVIIDGENYIIKYPGNMRGLNVKDVEMSYTNSPACEYIGSHIYGLLNIPVHETHLGIYKDKNVVYCKDFRKDGEELQQFSEIKISSFDEDLVDSSGHSTTGISEDIQEALHTIKHSELLNTIDGVEERFWDMFVVDALIGNPDRNNTNWGVIRRIDGTRILSPVYDNGNCLNNKWDDEKMLRVLENENSITSMAYKGHVCCMELNGSRINPYKLIQGHEYEECDKAIVRICDRLDTDRIMNMIYDIPKEFVSDTFKKYSEQLITMRVNDVLQPAYAQVMSRQKSYMQDAIQTASKRYGHEQDIEQEREYSL